MPFFRPDLPPLDDYVAELRAIWSSRMLSNFADYSQRLEGLSADYLGSPHVLCVVSGDIGLVLTLKALELPEGSPCFVSSFTFNSTINAAIWAGLEPVIVDADPSTFNIDAEALARGCERDGRAGVVLATHVFGNPCDADAVAAVAASYGHRVVYDAAHGYGSVRDGVHVGCLGDAEVFSLSGTKLVTSAEGGLVSTPHDWLAERLRYLRAYGFQNDYNSRYVGLNAKMSELHAALGVLTLARVEQAVARRNEIAQRYRALLGDRVGWQAVRPVDRSTHKDVCVALGDRRDDVEARLTSAGIATKRYFLPLHRMAPYAAFTQGPLPVADRTYDTTLCLPAFNDLDDRTVDHVAEVVLEGLEGTRARG